MYDDISADAAAIAAAALVQAYMARAATHPRMGWNIPRVAELHREFFNAITTNSAVADDGPPID